MDSKRKLTITNMQLQWMQVESMSKALSQHNEVCCVLSSITLKEEAFTASNSPLSWVANDILDYSMNGFGGKNWCLGIQKSSQAILCLKNNTKIVISLGNLLY